jgi:hypothetical protein
LALAAAPIPMLLSGARNVLDKELLTEMVRQLLRDHAGAIPSISL